MNDDKWHWSDWYDTDTNPEPGMSVHIIYSLTFDDDIMRDWYCIVTKVGDGELFVTPDIEEIGYYHFWRYKIFPDLEKTENETEEEVTA